MSKETSYEEYNKGVDLMNLKPQDGPTLKKIWVSLRGNDSLSVVVWRRVIAAAYWDTKKLKGKYTTG